MARVGGAHHVLGVEHLLGELGHGEGAVLLGAARRERREADHEEVQTRERDHVDGELAEVAVELAREAEAAGDAGHGGGHQVVEVTVGRGGELEGAEADVVQGLVVEDHDSSEFSTSWWTESTALYGSTTVSDTLGDGKTEKVHMMRSGYSSRILEIRRVPMPEPVPPPSEWVIWKPWRQSQDSASLRTTSRTESMSSAPSV